VIVAPIGGVFGDGPSNDANCILPRLTPRCHGNEIWDKIGYNLACVEDFCMIFVPIGGFLGMGHRMPTIALFPDRPPLPWQQNLGQYGL